MINRPYRVISLIVRTTMRNRKNMVVYRPNAYRTIMKKLRRQMPLNDPSMAIDAMCAAIEVEEQPRANPLDGTRLWDNS